MPLISEIEKKTYLQKYKWAISYSDGDVTTHKMLDFVNPRTATNVFYKPTFKTMLAMFFGFIAIMAAAVVIYTQLRWLWTHWVVWFIGVLAIYIVCVSGVVYDIIHNVPFVGRDKDTGEAQIFTGGVIYGLSQTREQYGAEGLVVSLTISAIGVLFTSVVVISRHV
jgi:oligosaccharyltransferase complex subunit gamma